MGQFLGPFLVFFMVPFTVMVLIPALIVINTYRQIRRGRPVARTLTVLVPPVGPAMLAWVFAVGASWSRWEVTFAATGTYAIGAWLISKVLARADAQR